MFAICRRLGITARLDYEASCDTAWRSLRGRVRGWIGDRRVSVDIDRSKDGAWSLNGTAVPGLEGCLDLDFGFTPATNLFQVRRAALREGEAASVPAAWWDLSVQTLLLLPQRYERRGRLTYWYEAPATGYAGLLELSEDGFIRRYPGLWEREE